MRRRSRERERESERFIQLYIYSYLHTHRFTHIDMNIDIYQVGPKMGSMGSMGWRHHTVLEEGALKRIYIYVYV